MGNLELIAAGVADKQVWASVARARKAVERGARLTASLLSFARRQLLQTDTYDVNLLIRDFVPVIRQSVGPSIKVDLQLEPQLRRCRVDVAHFEAVLLNLVINARDAMSDKGTLTFSTRRTTLSAEDLCNNHEATPGIFVAISVADNGTGMPADVTTKAFEPFFTTKQIGQGSGLGLSYVFGFVRQLGGHVRMESVSGCGTVVTLLLPERS
jgi:signal transduction histidine kinase